MRSLLLVLTLSLALSGQSRLMSEDDFERMATAVRDQPWAAKAQADLVAAADSWPASHTGRYGLKQLELPPEGGQWWHYYVCPTSGVRLRFEAPNAHICPVDNRRVTGWPYDQVIYAQRHDELANAARDLALAYRLSGRREYGERAAAILNLYAASYLTYPLHDVNNRDTRTGGRVHAQTLDEAIWLIPVAYAYDLLTGSDLLDDNQRQRIERDLLRAAAATIRRYDAGISNWQAWHNAGVAAVAFALRDEALIAAVVDGPSGFRFHLAQSLSPDGFWYEGSFTYHYYALDALRLLAEMASRNGVDLWAEPRLRLAFEAPMKFAFADGTLAAFNDATIVNLSNYSRLYESAAAHWDDARLAALAASRTRGKEALIYGPPALPPAEGTQLESAVFADSGYAVLRSASDHTVILKYGPHGGGHGHNDKLNIVSYAFGGVLAVDPGTQAYSAPTHATWDKSTVAHNTVVLDERNQAEATGELKLFKQSGGAAIARAQAGPVYRDAALERTVVQTADYALDVFDVKTQDGAEHTIDWLYHGEGAVQTTLPLAPASLGRQNGYQHLTATRSAAAATDWTLTFDGTQVAGGNYGSLFASTTAVKGAFEFSRAQAWRGTGAGRLSYEFNGAGYLLYSTAAIGAQPASALPASVKLAVYGDGSRHRLLLRINDASDERFVVPLATVDWTGWREFEIRDPAKWPTRYLGNNDGNVDLPVRTVSLELQQDAQGPRRGELFVDQIELTYRDEPEVVVADFEKAARSQRIWMLGAEGTTVFTGNGLGPDLTKPVPFVLARRRGAATRFVTLLEPFGGAAPGVTRFQQLDGRTLVVTGDGWEDTIELDADDVTYTRR